VCAAGRRLNPEVTFHDSDECLNRSYDLVFASNSLQYEEKWQPLLRRLAACSEWLMLSWVPVVVGAPFTVLQRAQRYHGTEYVSWVFSRDEVLTTVKDAGLELVREFVLLSQMEIAGAPELPTHVGFLARRCS
jgi:putative methyltransferase (TIGR04325 family)